MLQDLKDSTDRTALALAEDQRKRGKEGAVGVSDGQSAMERWEMSSNVIRNDVLIHQTFRGKSWECMQYLNILGIPTPKK